MQTMKTYLKHTATVIFVLLMTVVTYWQIDSYYEAKIYKEVAMALQACEAAMNSKASIELSAPRSRGLIVEKSTVEMPGIKVVIDKDDNWQTVAMLLVTLLGSYLGIRIINRLFKETK